VSCAWVARVRRAVGTPAVLKLGMPHMEAEHEIEGLRFWDGDPTVRVLEADDDLGAMLLERCEPGTGLRTLPEPEQDLILAGLLKRLWRSPAAPHLFRPLSALTAYWSAETLGCAEQWPDKGLVREGLRLLNELPRSAPARCCWQPICTPETFCGQSDSLGLSSIRNHSWAIPLTTQPSTFSIAKRECIQIRTERSVASQTCLEQITSAFVCGCSPAPQRGRAMSGRTTSGQHSREQ